MRHPTVPRHRPILRSAVLLLAAGGASAADLPRNASRYDFSALPAAMAAAMVRGSPSGFTLMIVKDRQVVFEQAVGDLTLADVVPIASASKMPSTTLIMSVVQEGLIGLDDRVADHLPFWPSSPADAKSTITIRQCISCTTGLPTDETFISDPHSTLDQAAQGIATLPLDFTPGTQFGYTGNGFQVAACVAEHATGRTWAQLLQERLTGPLGTTTFGYGAGANPRVAGGAASSTEDYARILAVHLADGRWQGRRLFPAAMIGRMRHDEFVDQGLTAVFNSPMPTDAWHYGLSWWLTPYVGDVAEISDAGAFGTVPWIDIERGYAAIILMKSTATVGLRVWNALKPVIDAAIDARRDIVLIDPATAAQDGSRVVLSAHGGAWGPESAIGYTWSVAAAPAGAESPVFAGNGSNDSQDCEVAITTPGTWTLQAEITARSAPGRIVSPVTVVIDAPATTTGGGGTGSGTTGSTGGGTGSGTTGSTGSGSAGGSSGGGHGCGMGGGLIGAVAALLLALRWTGGARRDGG